jgi:hypothetical protein
VSELGDFASKRIPTGYKNVLLHMKAHMDIQAQQMMQQQMAAQSAQARLIRAKITLLS